MKRTYLSLCMGIGGVLSKDLLERLDDSMRNNITLALKHRLSLEIVICEWNAQLPKIDWPHSDVRIRIIHACRAHAEVPNPNRLRYFEWYPKNIAIRRSCAQWVLSSNPDDLWSDELAHFLSTQTLKGTNFYRINRHDMKDGNVYRICYQTGAYSPETPIETYTKPQPGASAWGGPHMNAAGDFMLMTREAWFKIHGNPEKPYNHTIDGETVALALKSGLKQAVIPYPLYHPDHERTLNYNEFGGFIGPTDWNDADMKCDMNDENWGFQGRKFEESCIDKDAFYFNL